MIHPKSLFSSTIVKGRLVGAVCFFIFILTASSGFGAARDASRFYGAELLQDGRTVLFSYTHAKYVVKSSSLFNFGGGRAHYRKDQKYIGLYHIDRKETEVLKTFPMEHGTNGRANFLIQETRGRTAMIYREPQGGQRAGSSTGRYIMDIDQNTMTHVQVKKEMAERGMAERRSVWLAHQDGSLVVLAYSEGQKEGQKNSVPLGHIWLRRAGGQYHLLTRLGSYSATVDDKVLYYDHESRKSLTYDLVSGDSRIISNRERADLKLYNTNRGKPYQDVYVSLDQGGKALKLGRKIDGKYHYSPFPIDMTPLR